MRGLLLALWGFCFALGTLLSFAAAAQPIKIGFTESLTGGLAANGKAALLTKQIWAEGVNARGGLLGRPIELVYYDDQSSPNNAPAIVVKLLDVDKVDLLLGNGTNITSAIMPIVVQRNKLIMSLLSLAVNDQFKYPRYFQIMPYGPQGKEEISRGYFDAAMTMDPKPQTIALAGADAEFALNVLAGARAHASRLGLRIVYDRTYPPAMMDFSSVVRAIQAAGPDLVFIGSYPPDSAGLVRAALEGNLKAKMFGGGMIGLQYASLKQQFGDGLNGIVNLETFVREPTVQFPGIEDFIRQYRERAGAAQVDQLGHYVAPQIYSAMQILEQAITSVGSVDDDKLAAHMHKAKFSTVLGEIQFGPDGEWSRGRILMTQFQKVKGNSLEQFDRAGTQVILYPPEFKSGNLQYPYPPATR